MALQRTIEKAAFVALPEALKTEYVERDGKYALNVDDSPMLSALETERQARKDLEARLKGYGDLTPEQVKALTEGKTKAERDKDFAQGNFEKILAEEREKANKTSQLRDEGEKRLRASLESALIDVEATRAIVANGGNPTLLLPIIKARAKLETVGDREVAVVIGEKGGPLLKAGAQKSDEYMPISEFVATVLKPDKNYAGAFAANVGSGSGSPTPRPPGSPTHRIKGSIADAIRRGDKVLTRDVG